MELKVYLTVKNDNYAANAIYSEGKMIVLKGSKIQLKFAEHIRGGGEAKSYRNNREYVDENGLVIQDCKFNSPSTAAQFVLGRSINGYMAWHIEKKVNLKKYLDEKRM